MEINEYKRINMQKLPPQVQDSVENEETHEEKQGQANLESKEASAPDFAAPFPPLAQKLLQNKFSTYRYGNPLRTNLLMNVLQTSDVKVTASIQPVAKLNLKNPSEPKVICYDCREKFPTKKEMMDDKRDSDHPSQEKCNQHDYHKSKCWLSIRL